MNRLSQERSAYLQHARGQGIDWYPWSDEAFERARKENKPVFLSSGAVWCHWCHVMARESFENDDVARLLNEHFVSIKLDRDERPDVDRRYQQAVAAMGFGGGWPLSIFLTPDRKPFYGGTYFPLEESFGRPGFKAILKTISDLYRDKKEEIFSHSDRLLEALKHEQVPAGELRESLVSEGVLLIIPGYDRRNGGFGQAPKFPMSGALEFLINRYFLSKEQHLRDMVVNTLTAMAKGGIYDHLGGGFHRYSTDQGWIIPHFEKMADDNAWLLRNYTDAYAVFHEPYFRDVAQGIIDFFLTDLSDPEGGFYASQDADVTPTDEGGYFTWTDDDFKAVLNEREYEVLSRYLFHQRGVMHHDPTRKVLFVERSMEEVAREAGIDLETVAGIVAKGRRMLLEFRSGRVKPFVDRAMYTSLNGLAISAFFKAHMTLGIEEAKQFALKSIERVMAINVAGGELQHREGIRALLDDYIFFSDALVCAYEATGDPIHLERAKGFMDVCLERFQDKEGGGFFDTDGEVIGMRLKGIEDIPHPSANALAIPLLLKLAFICGEDRYRAHAVRALETFSPYGQSHGIHGSYYFCAVDCYFNLMELTVNALPESDLGRAVLSGFYPYKVVRYGDERGNVIVCRRGVCHEPAETIESLKKLLDSPP
jgi:uncharacterized protein YyaL (SSP411 family)